MWNPFIAVKRLNILIFFRIWKFRLWFGYILRIAFRLLTTGMLAVKTLDLLRNRIQRISVGFGGIDSILYEFIIAISQGLLASAFSLASPSIIAIIVQH